MKLIKLALALLLIVILCFWVAFKLIPNSYYSHKVVVLEAGNLEGSPIDILVEQYGENLSQELIVGTLPGYSNRLIQRKLGITNYFRLPSWANVELSGLYDLYLKFSQQLPFGGYLLMEHNFARFQTKLEQIKFLTSLSSRYSKKIIIKNKSWDYHYYIEIKPFLFSDCVPWGAHEPYCRILELEKNVKSGEGNYSTISKYFEEIGLNSPIGPIMDLEINSNSISMQEKEKLSFQYKKEFREINRYNQIPIAKHFGYASKIGDTHREEIRDDTSLVDIQKNILYFYKQVEDLKIPYMVMTGHHYLTSIDDINPVSMSKKVEHLIRENLKNSVIISDELSMMKAYSNYSLERAIIDSISDIRMVHSGLSFDLISRRDEIYSAINKLNKDRVQYSLRKVLELKSKYGLIEIKKIKNDSQ